jgi:TrmH family RNA methyltransferase
MGSLTRVNVVYTDLDNYLSKTTLPIFGTFMEGDVIYGESLPENGIVVLGNEANGISEAIESRVGQKITIPRFGDFQQTESLNVATAAAVILSEFRRNSSGR